MRQRERERERERERDLLICCSTYLCNHWLILACALTRDWTYNLGVSRQCSNQLNYLARVDGALFFGRQSTLELLSVPVVMVSSPLCCFCFTFMYGSPGCDQSPLLKAQTPYIFATTPKSSCLPGNNTEEYTGPYCLWSVDICLFPMESINVPLSLPPRTLSLWQVSHVHFSELRLFQKANLSSRSFFLFLFFSPEENFGMREPWRP